MAYVPGTAALPSAVGAMNESEFGAASAPAPVLGSYTDPETGERRSARLARIRATAAAAVESSSADIDPDVTKYLMIPSAPAAVGRHARKEYTGVPDGDTAMRDTSFSGTKHRLGGGRRMRGGDLTSAQKSGVAAFTTAALIATAVAYQYGLHPAVGTFAISGGVVTALSSLADGKTKEAATAAADYLKEKGAYKVAGSLGTLGKASLSFADSGLSLAFAVIRFPVSLATATVGIAGKLVKRGAEGVQKFSDRLESSEEQDRQADLIIKNGTLAFTAALAALTLSGALPIMTIFSVMLWTGKLYASPLGRAVGIIELYMWWINQSPEDQKAIADQTKTLANKLSKQAATDMEWVGKQAPKVAEAIALVGGKIKEKASDVGAEFEAGFAAGIQDAENPLMTALSLGFCRATGLIVDPRAPPPKPDEKKDDLENLAENIIKEALRGGVDPEKLKAPIAKLKEIRDAAAAVKAARAALVPAEAELAAALAPPARREAAGDGAAGAPAAPGAAAAGEAAAGPGRRAPGEARDPKKPRRAAPVGGRRRKTRRKRMVRRITKKVKDFYY
jgi:hypothetical protein